MLACIQKLHYHLNMVEACFQWYLILGFLDSFFSFLSFFPIFVTNDALRNW